MYQNRFERRSTPKKIYDTLRSLTPSEIAGIAMLGAFTLMGLDYAITPDHRESTKRWEMLDMTGAIRRFALPQKMLLMDYESYWRDRNTGEIQKCFNWQTFWSGYISESNECEKVEMPQELPDGSVPIIVNKGSGQLPQVVFKEPDNDSYTICNYSYNVINGDFDIENPISCGVFEVPEQTKGYIPQTMNSGLGQKAQLFLSGPDELGNPTMQVCDFDKEFDFSASFGRRAFGQVENCSPFSYPPQSELPAGILVDELLPLNGITSDEEQYAHGTYQTKDGEVIVCSYWRDPNPVAQRITNTVSSCWPYGVPSQLEETN